MRVEVEALPQDPSFLAPGNSRKKYEPRMSITGAEDGTRVYTHMYTGCPIQINSAHELKDISVTCKHSFK